MALIDGAAPGAQDGDDAPRSTPLTDRSRPLHWFAGRLHEVLDDVTAGGLHASDLSATETAETLVELSRAESRLAAIRAALLPHADVVDVAAEATPAATSTGAWLGNATRTPVGAAHRFVKVAKRLEAAYAPTLDAALAGELDPPQSEVIVNALDALPSWIDDEQRLLAEQHLLGLASEHDAKTLKGLARHLLHVIDPEKADEELARRLEKEEADAARRTMFSIFDDGKGTCHGKFRVPSLEGAMFLAGLNALASPNRPDPIEREVPDPENPDGPCTQRTAPEILGQALCEFLHRYPAKKLPKIGGGLATVLAVIPLEVLEGRLGVATLSSGGQLTAGATRRLACQHGLIAGVFGAKSQPLDLSRRVRFHTEAQRIAMTVRDKTCTAEGCSVPASRCHAHHKIAWAKGGGTSVKDGRMVCPRHHTLVHRPDYTAHYLPNGKIRLSKTRAVRRQ